VPDGVALVDELDLLLTGGRLSPHVRQVILRKYLHRKDGWGEEDAVLHAMQLFTLSLEFHSTNFNALGEPRVKSAYTTVGGVRGEEVHSDDAVVERSVDAPPPG